MFGQACSKTALSAKSSDWNCKISMTKLQQAPFFLRSGAPIRIRAAACNKNGCGLPCTQFVQPIRLTGTPTILVAPKVKTRVGTKVVIEWASLPNASFELWYREEVSTQPNCQTNKAALGCPRLIDTTKATSYPLNNLKQGNIYFFKIRALSSTCGAGTFSQELKINMAVKPSEPALKLTLEGCSVRATWSSLNNGGSKITAL